MTRYYYVDYCTTDDLEYGEYESKEEFYNYMLWNRDVAKSNGDRVPTLKSIKKDFQEPNADCYVNGINFVKLTTVTIKEYLERGF